MQRPVLFLLLTAPLLSLSSQSHEKSYPNRWVRISSNLRDDGEVERIRKSVETASKHGLTGVALSAGLDQLDLKPPEYFERLRRVRDLCANHKLEVIPSFMSVGYGGSVLSHDKNLAAGLPVRDALFIVSGGKGKLSPDPPIEIANGNFGSWNYVPKELQLSSFWYYGKREASLRHFSGL